MLARSGIAAGMSTKPHHSKPSSSSSSSSSTARYRERERGGLVCRGLVLHSRSFAGFRHIRMSLFVGGFVCGRASEADGI